MCTDSGSAFQPTTLGSAPLLIGAVDREYVRRLTGSGTVEYMNRGRSVLIAIPALNEERSVGSVIEAVRKEQPAATVVVVDDGSTDRTAIVARQSGADVLSLPFNVGVGGAMRAAFLYALEVGADAVVQVDGDGQHDPAAIERLLNQLDDASVVIGARFAGAGSYRVRGPRAWAMKALALGLSRVTKSQLTDTTSGFRASDRQAIELFARHYPAEYLGDTVESLVIAVRAGLRVKQVPVEMWERQAGVPSQTPLKASLYLARALLALAVAVSRRRDHSLAALT